MILRNDIGFAHSRNRLTAVGGKWYTKFCVSVFQIAIICSEKGKFLEVFEIRDFLQCEKAEHGFRLICILTRDTIFWHGFLLTELCLTASKLHWNKFSRNGS